VSNVSRLGLPDYMTKTFSAGITHKKMKVPKLDFSVLKHNKEFKDWYSYSKMLEKSIIALQQKIKNLESDSQSCTEKNLALRAQNANLYKLNKKLVVNIKMLKKKIVEVKEKYNKRVQKAQKFGINNLEMTLPRFETEHTYDYGGDSFEKDAYIDDFNSQDSYGPEILTQDIRAYNNPNGLKLAITEEDQIMPSNTEYIHDEKAHFDINEVPSEQLLASKIVILFMFM
jgi:hypothetical protein